MLTIFGLITVIPGRKAPPTAPTAALLFSLLGVLYADATGVLFSAQENNGFRYTVDPLHMLLLAGFLTRIADRVRQSVASRTAQRVAIH